MCVSAFDGIARGSDRGNYFSRNDTGKSEKDLRDKNSPVCFCVTVYAAASRKCGYEQRTGNYNDLYFRFYSGNSSWTGNTGNRKYLVFGGDTRSV